MSSYQYRNTSSKGNDRKSANGFVHILLFYIIPFLIINGIIFFLATTKPRYEVIIADTDDYISTSFTFKVTSLFPYKDLSISLDGDLLELNKTGKKTYTAQVYKNGMLEIAMKNFNGMPAASFEQINTLDDNPPEVDDQVIEDGILTFHVSDSQAGIDYDSIYAVNSEGTTIRPLTLDKETGYVTFQVDHAGLVIHAKDLAGNEMIANCNISSNNLEIETIDSTQENENGNVEFIAE